MEDLVEMLKRIAKKNVFLFLHEDGVNIIAKGNVSNLTNPDKADISNYKKEIIELLLKRNEHIGNVILRDIVRLPVQDSYSISDAQRRLWVLSQFEDG